MINIEFDKELQNRVETFLKEHPKALDKILKKAVSKVGSFVKKKSKKEIDKKYEVSNKSIFKGLKTKNKQGESTLLGSLSRNDIGDFYVSLREPKKVDTRLTVSVRKQESTEMRTLFYGFYKTNTERLGLYIRLGDRNRIVKTSSPSIYQMGSNVDILDDLEKEASLVFNNEVKKLFEKEIE